MGHGLSEMVLFLWELEYSLLLQTGNHSGKQKEEEQVWASSIFILIADASATNNKIAMVKIIVCCEPFSSAQVVMSQSHTLLPRLWGGTWRLRPAMEQGLIKVFDSLKTRRHPISVCQYEEELTDYRR